jgi:YaiO family outer membrane protein
MMMPETKQLRRFAVLVLWWSLSIGTRAGAQVDTASAGVAPAPGEALVTQTQPEAQARGLTNYVESGGNYLALGNGYGYWRGGYTRGVYQQGRNIWNAEVNGQHEFGDAGVYMAAGDTYNFNPDWYGSLTMGTSVGGFFWPRYRADAFLNKKWLGRKQWITTAGLGYYAAKDAHRDHSFYLGSAYYFEKPWIVEEGIYFNISNPGTAFAPAGFVAVTCGRNKQQYLTVRGGLGEEAYQLIGPTTSLTQFNSQTLTITWRKWMGTSWGINLIGDYYHSPFYVRGGGSFGLFKDF